MIYIIYVISQTTPLMLLTDVGDKMLATIFSDGFGLFGYQNPKDVTNIWIVANLNPNHHWHDSLLPSQTCIQMQVSLMYSEKVILKHHKNLILTRHFHLWSLS